MEPRYAVNCSILLTELPLLRRAQAAAEAGFDAVEFWWPWPESVPADAEVDAFVRAIEDAGVALVGLNLAAGDMAGGDRGLVSWPGRASELRDNVDVVVELAKRTGCRTFNALYGNRIDGVAAREQDELATENLGNAAAAVAGVGGQLVIEPLSGAPRYPLRTEADALAVVDRVAAHSGATNLALLADLYHLAANEVDVPAVIERHTARFGHVQIADHPGRGAPGTGGLPLGTWLARIRALGYAGWVALEYKAGPGVDPFGWLASADRGGWA
ncbi:MAG TPA: TIM barrel protein [Pseudonocardia sp.]|jgi:hydroxypyruvate isomerase